MGYTCRGESGAFTLRRRTSANLTAELRLDVGTCRNVVAIFMVLGLGFKATLLLPVSASAVVSAQYPIGDADRWQKIVENLAGACGGVRLYSSSCPNDVIGVQKNRCFPLTDTAMPAPSFWLSL
jgi:hypothetical protein